MSAIAKVRVALKPKMTCLEAKGHAYLNYSPHYSAAFVKELLQVMQSDSPTVVAHRPNGSKVDVPWQTPVFDAFDLPEDSEYVNVTIDVLESWTAEDTESEAREVYAGEDDGVESPNQTASEDGEAEAAPLESPMASGPGTRGPQKKPRARPVSADGAPPAPPGDTPEGAEADTAPADLEDASESPGRGIPVAVPVDREMDNFELSVHSDMFFFKEFQNETLTRAEAEEINKDPENRVKPLETVVTPEDVAATYILIVFTHPKLDEIDYPAIEAADDAFAELTKEEQKAINSQADKLFWQLSNFPEGHILKKGEPGFDQLAESWKAFRADLMAKKERIDNLPPRIFDVFGNWAGGVQITPENYDTVLALAERLERMTDAQIADFIRRTDGKTTDPLDVLSDLERYMDELIERQEIHDERLRLQDDLTGQAALFEAWQWKDKTINLHPGPSDYDRNEKIDKARKDFPRLLADHGYESEEEFERAVEAYEKAFRDEAIWLAEDALDMAEAGMYEYEKSLTDDDIGEILEALKAVHIDDLSGQAALNAVSSAARGHPQFEALLSQLRVSSDLFAVDMNLANKLADARSISAIRKVIEEALDERREAIDDTRAMLKEDPDEIWGFDAAIAQAQESMDVQKGSIHELIVEKAVKVEGWSDTARDLVIAAGAMIAGFMMAGPAGSAIAIAGAVGTGVAASAEAWILWNEYVTHRDANQAGLLSADPDLAWVIIQLMLLPLDAFEIGDVAKSAIKLAKLDQVAKTVAKGTPTGDALSAFSKSVPDVQTMDEAGQAVDGLMAKVDHPKPKVKKAIKEAAKKKARQHAVFNEKIAKANIPAYTGPGYFKKHRKYFCQPVCDLMSNGQVSLGAMLEDTRISAILGKAGEIDAKGIEELKDVLSDIRSSDWPFVRTRATDLDVDSVDFREAMVIWGQHPEMSSKRFVETILSPLVTARPANQLATDILDKKTSDRLLLVVNALKDIEKEAAKTGVTPPTALRRDIANLRSEISEARKLAETEGITPEELAALRRRVEVELDRVADQLPLIDEVLAAPPDLLDGLDAATRKKALKHLQDNIKEAYLNDSDLLEELANNAGAIAGENIEDQLYHELLHRHITSKGEKMGTPEDWSLLINDPVLLEDIADWQDKTLERLRKELSPEEFEKAKAELGLDKLIELPAPNGFVDLSTFSYGAGTSLPKPHVKLQVDDYKIPKVNSEGKKYADRSKQLKALRDKHFAKADALYAKELNKHGAPKPDYLPKGEWKQSHVEKLRSVEKLTWHHIEYSYELILVEGFAHEAFVPHDGGIFTNAWE